MGKKGRTPWGPEFDRLLAHMRRLRPFKFRVVKNLKIQGDKCDGGCVPNGNNYTIKIDRDLTQAEAEDSLRHELSHCLDVALNGWGRDEMRRHGDTWGVEYARVWRHWLEFLYQEEERNA